MEPIQHESLDALLSMSLFDFLICRKCTLTIKKRLCISTHGNKPLGDFVRLSEDQMRARYPFLGKKYYREFCRLLQAEKISFGINTEIGPKERRAIEKNRHEDALIWNEQKNNS